MGEIKSGTVLILPGRGKQELSAPQRYPLKEIQVQRCFLSLPLPENEEAAHEVQPPGKMAIGEHAFSKGPSQVLEILSMVSEEPHSDGKETGNGHMWQVD